MECAKHVWAAALGLMKFSSNADEQINTVQKHFCSAGNVEESITLTTTCKIECKPGIILEPRFGTQTFFQT